MISNQILLATFLDEPMFRYFRIKIPGISDAELFLQIEETLKFLTIADQCTGAIPVSRQIDKIWHYWILQTQEYMELCKLLPTGEYIHHSSNDYDRYFDPAVNERSNLSLDIKMLALYVANFGPFEEDRIRHWLLASHLIEKCGWTVQQLNDWLAIERVSEIKETYRARPTTESIKDVSAIC
ncbi:MAG: hypothetical protein ABW044_12055 [Cellvibrio sp.]